MTTELQRRRYRAWLDGEIDPPWEAVDIPDACLLELLALMADEGHPLERRTILIDLARTRLAALLGVSPRPPAWLPSDPDDEDLIDRSMRRPWPPNERIP